MSVFQQLESLLRQSLDDFDLSNEEKNQFKALFSQIEDDDTRSFIRNKSFQIAREVLVDLSESTDQSNRLKTIKWLEQIVKLNDIVRSSHMPMQKPHAYFSPGNHCANKIIELCESAKQSIKVCVFTLSDDRITQALLDAHQRHIAIEIITDNDKSSDLGSDVLRLKSSGIHVKMDDTRNHMHHKFAVFDERTLVNGSFNWTRSASKYNQENIVVHTQPSLVKSFLKEFHRLWNKF